MRNLKKAATLTVFTLVLAMTPAAVKASLVYTWAGDTAKNGIVTSGTLTVNEQYGNYYISSLSFTYGSTMLTTDSVSGNGYLLGDNVLALGASIGFSSPNSNYNTSWSLSGWSAPDEMAIYGFAQQGATYGDWIPQVTAVPEPATVISGILLLLPLGVSAARILRKSRAV
jgi:hypothetical protein